MAKQGKVIVIGAAPSGIGAGLALEDEGIVVEHRRTPGGLSGTIRLEGAVVDLGGHCFHTPHRCVRELVFDAVEMYEQRRDARCFVRGTMVPYPFQRNFRALGEAAVTRDCEAGLESVRGDSQANDFEELLLQRFGRGIAEHFLLPYNRKLWGEDLRRLSPAWARERVADAARPSAKDTVVGSERRPLQAGSMIAYPARGGFGEIALALARRLPDLRLRHTVERIDLRRREVMLAGRRALRWRKIVSTMPLDKLLAMVSDVPASLAADVQGLEKISLALVIAVIGHAIDSPIQRIYVADPDQPAHKIVLNHNSSPYLRSLPRHGVVAEVSYSSRMPLAENDLENKVVYGLRTMGIIAAQRDVVATKVVELPYGYPVPTHERDEIVARVTSWLRERGIYGVGRFGEWAYINSDEALWRGLQVGKELVGASEGAA